MSSSTHQSLDRDNPWPGLAPFDEGDRQFFHGRNAESVDLLRLVRREPLTVLFGRSGLGKTSLLKAGLFPVLRNEDFVPVYVRLDHVETAPLLREQVLRELQAACDAGGVQAAQPAAQEGLWSFFHRRAAEFWSALNQPVTPVVVFDQFEEIFTLGQEGDAVRARAAEFLAELADLVENRPPLAVRQVLERDPAEASRYEFRRATVKLVLSFREDFLAEMEGLKSSMPSVMVNRLRLLPMDGTQAYAVVTESGRELVDDDVARRILRLAWKNEPAPPVDPAEFPRIEIDPALLSVVCSELNHKRRQATPPLARITPALLAGADREILAGFYERSMAGLDARVRAFVEDELITDRGFRDSHDWHDALALPGLTREALDALTARRLLRVDERQGQRRLELTHDVLTRVVMDSRDRRRAREAEQAAEARERAALEQQRKNRRNAAFVLAGSALMMLLAALAAWQAMLAREATRLAEQKSLDARESAGRAGKSLAYAATQELLAKEASDRAKSEEREAEHAKQQAARLRIEAQQQKLEADRLVAQARSSRLLALAHQLNLKADAALEAHGDPVRSLLLTVHSLRSAWTVEGQQALVERLDSIGRAVPSSWRPHPAPLRALALSPDGQWLASAGPRALQVQSTSGATVDLKSRNGHGYFHPLSFSPGGEWLAAACDESVVCVYDTRTWQSITQLPPVGSAINVLSFSPDGKALASASYEAPAIHLYAVPSWAEQPPITSKDRRVLALAFSADGQRLAVSGASSIELWQFATRTPLTATRTSGGRSIAFSPDGQRLAATGNQLVVLEIGTAPDGGVQLTRAADAGRVKAGSFGQVAFSADGRYIGVSEGEAGVRIVDAESGRQVALLPQSAAALVFDAARSVLAGNGNNGTISSWQLDDQAVRRIVHAGAVHAVALSADRRWLASASSGNDLRIFDAGNGRELHSLRQATDKDGLAFSPDGRWLSSVEGKNLWLIDTKTWRASGPFEHEDSITAIAFGPNGNLLATTTAWDAPTGARYGIKRPSRVRVWEIASRRELAWRYDIEGDRKHSLAAQKALDAVKVAAGGDAALAEQSKDWKPVRIGHPEGVNPNLMIPQTRWLAAESARRKPLSDAVLQRARAGHAAGESDGVLFAFSADGGLLASAREREVRLWHLKPDDLVADACARLPRNLGCAEWRGAFGDLPYEKTCPGLPEPNDIAACRAPVATPGR